METLLMFSNCGIVLHTSSFGLSRAKTGSFIISECGTFVVGVLSEWEVVYKLKLLEEL